MFSYTDSVFQTTNSPTKELKIEDLQRPPHQHQDQHQQQQQLHPLNTNSYLSNNHSNSNSGPLYPYNDMLYSIDNQQQQLSSSSYDNLSHHHYHQQQDSAQQQQRWQQEHPPQQQHSHSNTTSNSFYSDIRNQSQHPQFLMDHSSSFDHYNAVSPFSSPVPNNNVLMGNHSTPTSQRSSLQSLPSVPPIPSSSNNNSMLQQPHHHQQPPQLQQSQQQQQQSQRPRITTSLWDDEGTVCYQVDVRGICVARRQDNDMVNGTKLLNVTGMSRGKRDGILKNEKGRVVVKVGAMHLKGVWVTFARAKALAVQFNIADHLHPLFVDDPAMYFYSNQLTPHNYFIPNHPIYLQSQDSFTSSHNNNSHIQRHRTSPSNSSTTASANMVNNDNNQIMASTSSNESYMHSSASAPSLLNFPTMFPNNNSNNNLSYPTTPSSTNPPVSQGIYSNHLPSAPPVPSMIPPQMSMYGYGTPNTNNNNTPPYNHGNTNTTSTTTSTSNNHSPTGGIDMHFN